jgi:hypothetical protein
MLIHVTWVLGRERGAYRVHGLAAVDAGVGLGDITGV